LHTDSVSFNAHFEIFTTILLYIAGTDCPKLRHLHRYIRQISSNWYGLGIELLDCYQQLNAVQQDYPNNVDMCCSRMLQLWLQKSKKASWNQFLKALKVIGMTDLAHKIRLQLQKGMKSNDQN